MACHLNSPTSIAWIRGVAGITYEEISPNRRQALDVEREAIFAEQPKFNIYGKMKLKKPDPNTYRAMLERHAKKAAQMIELRNRGWTLQRIADKLSISRQRVHQIVRRYGA